MHFIADRMDRLQRSLTIALNQEWPKLSTTRKRLAGVTRPVWVLPQAEIKLAKGKSVRAQPVDVVNAI